MQDATQSEAAETLIRLRLRIKLEAIIASKALSVMQPEIREAFVSGVRYAIERIEDMEEELQA